MRSPSSGLAGTRPNLDGAVRDEDTFVLGDEDYSDCEQEQGLDATALEADTFMSTTVPPVPPVAPVAKVESTTLEDKPMEPPVPKYHIAPSDTLQGIVLRFGLDSGLPIGIETPEQEATRKADREKEKAEKKLQTMVKEVDWRVAKAYVALADDDVEELEERERWERKRKEMGGDGPTWKSNLQERAIARYLDDDEWEAQQRGGKASSTEKGGPIRKWWS
ncbi:hypothetical protein H0H92_009429 [Tricholoma furcatifolium]|nr:hypothetical protein H0H92_009429 [Tricholoma furcatifolium]